MSRRTVVFLGAGASVPHGYPTINEMLPRIWQSLSDGSWRKWGGLSKRRDGGERVRELARVLRTLLPGLPAKGEFTGGASITDLVSLLDQLLAEGRMPLPKLSEEILRRARGTLQLALNGVLQGNRKHDLRDDLVSWLLSRATSAPNDRVSLISTNYDTKVEQQIFRRLIDRRVSIGSTVDLGIPWRDAHRDELHMRPKQARLAVLKLHGSLNWVRCEICGHVTVNVRQRIAAMEFWTKVVVYNQCQCLGRLRSVLVTPSYVRDVRDPNLLSIWNAAVEDLRRANEWVLIGYSLPSEDIAIRSILLRAFHTRVERASLRIRVVQFERPQIPGCPPDPTRMRYRAFFPRKHLRARDYLTDGLEKFVRAQRVPSRRELDARVRRAFPST